VILQLSQTKKSQKHLVYLKGIKLILWVFNFAIFAILIKNREIKYPQKTFSETFYYNISIL